MLAQILKRLSTKVEQHSPPTPALALLAAAERWRGVFVVFDARARIATGLTDVLEQVWKSFSTPGEHPRLVQLLEARVPGDTWVVDGLVDGVTQECANLLLGSLALSSGTGAGTPEWSPFEILRTLLCQKWYGATDLGSGEHDERFETRLVGDVRFHDETDFLREALRRAPTGTADDLGSYKAWAASRSIDVSCLMD